MVYSALIDDAARSPHMRKVLIVGVRDEMDARRVLWERLKVVAASLGPVVGVEVLVGDWVEGAGAGAKEGEDG